MNNPNITEQELISLIQTKNIDSPALDIYKTVNLVDFLYDLEYGTRSKVNPSHYNDTSLTRKFPLNKSEILFLAQQTDINQYGTYDCNSNKHLVVFLANHPELQSSELFEFIRLKNTIQKPSGEFLLAALKIDLFPAQTIDKMINENNVNRIYSHDFSNVLQHLILDTNSLEKLNQLPVSVFDKILSETKYYDIDRERKDLLDTLFDNIDSLPHALKNIVLTTGKSTYLNTINTEILIIDLILEGKKPGCFSDIELKGVVDKFIGTDFSIPLMNKKDRQKEFAHRGNKLIQFLKLIDNLSYTLKEKIELLENHPNSTTVHHVWRGPSQSEAEPFRAFPTPEFKKHVSDDILDYMFNKAQYALNQSSDLTRESERDMVFNMIGKIRNTFNPSQQGQHIKIKN